MSRYFAPLALAMVFVSLATPAAAQDSVYLEELTWTEARDAIKGGKTVAIIPTGGTEQGGPHMVLGKHNYIMQHCAGEIARRLGNALVAPVLQYVPEGSVDPPTDAMLFPGTITLPDEFYMKVVEWAARSLKVHGFTDIALLGDSGENQPGLKVVAARLTKEWAGSGTQVHYINEYYEASASPSSTFDFWLVDQGEKKEDIGSHAGVKDTSNLMAVEALQPGGARLIRPEKLANWPPTVTSTNGANTSSGASGNTARASAAYGKVGLGFKIEAGVNQIRKLTQRGK